MGLKLILTKEEETDLLTIVRSTKVESRLKQRALLILDWRDGKTYDESQRNRPGARQIALMQHS